MTDDADRENEGDLIMAADRMTTEAMAFMVGCLAGSHDEAPDTEPETEALNLPAVRGVAGAVAAATLLDDGVAATRATTEAMGLKS